jgi:hypothetical protein
VQFVVHDFSRWFGCLKLDRFAGFSAGRGCRRGCGALVNDGRAAEQNASVLRSIAASDELISAMFGFWAHRPAISAQIVERAIERGELPASTDSNPIIGPLWTRVLLTGAQSPKTSPTKS